MVKLYFRKPISRSFGKDTAKVISNELFKAKHALKFSPNIHSEIQKVISELGITKYTMKKENEAIERTLVQILILTYPIFKVANVDSKLQKKRDLVLNRILIHFLSEIVGSAISRKERKKFVQLYIKDFLFINENKEKYNYVILHASTGFSKEIKNSIVRLMIKTAEISGGVGELEFGMIDYLTKEFLS